MERIDVIAWLLAARHDTGIEQLAEYAEARQLVESDPGLAAAYEQEKAYYDQHEDYLDFIRLPNAARERIKEQLRAATALAPVGQRVNFPWRPLAIAASLAAVATFGWVLLRPDAAPPVAMAAPVTIDGFRQFSANQVKAGITLDYEAGEPTALLAWLQEAGSPAALGLQEKLAGLPTLGCKVLNWEGHTVSLICFRLGDEVVHLFVTPASGLPSEELARAAGRGVYAERQTRSWTDGGNAFVLVAHRPGQGLNGFAG